MTEQVLLALGSNLESPVQQVTSCMKALNDLPESRIVQCSSLYSSTPRGPQDQDDYVNAAVLIETRLSPSALLERTQALERSLGRVKTRHWGERIIDIDIAFYGMQQIELNTPQLTIPHQEALLRDFVIVPCLEIAAHWRLPDGSLLSEAAAHCLRHNLHKIDANLACP